MKDLPQEPRSHSTMRLILTTRGVVRSTYSKTSRRRPAILYKDTHLGVPTERHTKISILTRPCNNIDGSKHQCVCLVKPMSLPMSGAHLSSCTEYCTRVEGQFYVRLEYQGCCRWLLQVACRHDRASQCYRSVERIQCVYIYIYIATF